MNAYIRKLVLYGVVAFSLRVHLCAEEKLSPPKAADIAKASEAAISRYQTENCSWTTRFLLPSGEEFTVKVVSATDHQSWVFSHLVGGKEQTSFKLVEKNETWHVIEPKRQVKYRPYEAELRMPYGYILHSLSALQFMVNEEALAAAKFEKREGGVCTYLIDLPPQQKQLAQQLAANMDRIAKEMPDVFTPQMKLARQLYHDMATKGASLKVDEKTGLIVQVMFREWILTFENFQWLESAPVESSVFSGGITWQDETQPFSEDDLADCIMIRRDPGFKIGAGDPQTDGYLLNLKSGQIRRLPFPGTFTDPGIFLSDRTHVVALGVNNASGELGYLRIGLLAGDVTRLDIDGLPLSFIRMAKVSPDGNKMALLPSPLFGDLVKRQITMVDMQGGEAKPVGKPQEISEPFSWLPDGEGFIIQRYRPIDGNLSEKMPTFVSRMNLAGSLKDLFGGESPLVLPKQNKILYQELDTKLWHTRDLEGNNRKIFGDGLKHHHEPALSPDGARVIFVRREDHKPSELIVYEIENPTGKSVFKAVGYTSMPVWR